jgi:hypothetical protein
MKRILHLFATCLAFWAVPAFAEGGDDSPAGRAAYQKHCAACHGQSLDGGLGPALVGKVYRDRQSNGERRIETGHFVIIRSVRHAPRLAEGRGVQSAEYRLERAFAGLFQSLTNRILNVRVTV